MEFTFQLIKKVLAKKGSARWTDNSCSNVIEPFMLNSYSLESLHKNWLGVPVSAYSDSVGSHAAEKDCFNLIRVMRVLGHRFFTSLDAESVDFSTITPMY